MRMSKRYLIVLATTAVLFSVHSHPKQRYISIESFLSRYKTLGYHWDPLNLTFEIRNHSRRVPRRVQLRIDSQFYIFNNLQNTRKGHPIYRDNKILLPFSWVKELERILSVYPSRPINSKKYKAINLRPLAIEHRSKNNKSKSIGIGKANKSSSSSLDFIVIDPGHGGRDPGARGHSNILEKNITLKFSKELVKTLKKEFPHTLIIMTRNRDHFISLERRGTIANRYLKKDRFGIFLSLHFNATFSTRSNGFEIYYLDRNPTNSIERMQMINSNLYSVRHKGAKKIVSHLMDAQIQQESKVLAKEIHHNFLTGINGMVKSRGIRRADFSVIRSVSMPALLIELGYLTNRTEAAMLQTRKFHRNTAKAIAKGIKSFLNRRPRI